MTTAGFEELICPNCGTGFTQAFGVVGRRAVYCSRACQVRALRRRTAPVIVRLRFTGARRRRLERLADALGVTPEQYVEALVVGHIDSLGAMTADYHRHNGDDHQEPGSHGNQDAG